MNLEQYTNDELPQIRADLRRMLVHENVIEYVEATCRMAYAIGNRDGFKDAGKSAFTTPSIDLIAMTQNILGIKPLARDGRDC